MLKGVNLAERVLLQLVKSGMGREEAYALTKRAAFSSYKKGVPFSEELMRTSKISKVLRKEVIVDLTNPENYLGLSEEIVKRAVKEINSNLGMRTLPGSYEKRYKK